MGANTRFLENPWRIRGLDAPVEIRLYPKLSGIARVTEASLSGALVKTRVQIALNSLIALRPIAESGIWLNARVLRLDEDAIAIEWIDPRMDYLAILLTERTK